MQEKRIKLVAELNFINDKSLVNKRIKLHVAYCYVIAEIQHSTQSWQRKEVVKKRGNLCMAIQLNNEDQNVSKQKQKENGKLENYLNI